MHGRPSGISWARAAGGGQAVIRIAIARQIDATPARVRATFTEPAARDLPWGR
ncbi:MAG: hypothetical protein JWR37_1958 [Mycobacterium sp.]|nr:hypothetical protein [Mycobacterium sp.]